MDKLEEFCKLPGKSLLEQFFNEKIDVNKISMIVGGVYGDYISIYIVASHYDLSIYYYPDRYQVNAGHSESEILKLFCNVKFYDIFRNYLIEEEKGKPVMILLKNAGGAD